MIAYALEDGSRITLRPSGTEPKLKSYYEVRVAVGADEPLASARARGQRLADVLRSGMRVADGAAAGRPVWRCETGEDVRCNA